MTPSTSQSPHPSPSSDDSSFYLNDLNAPRLSGPSFRVLTTLLESPFFGYPLRNRIFTASGFTAFRRRAATTPAPNIHPRPHPIHYPLPPPKTPPSLTDIDRIFHQLQAHHPLPRAKRPTISDYHSAYRSATLTPLQVANAILRLIHTSNQNSPTSPSLNAAQLIDRDAVLEQATHSTHRWRHGNPLSVLDGVPFTVKLNIDALPYQTACASGFSESHRVTRDSDVVRALKSAGMILVAKSGMDELGLGVRGFSMFAGQVRNPHDRRFVAGGSSGGSAASVAIALCPVSLGSDSGGSIRIPAACCGVYGLKPTFARISTHGRILTDREADAVDPSEICFGPIAVCASDLYLVYYVLAAFAVHRKIAGEPEFEGRVDLCEEGEGVRDDVSGLRIGVYEPWVRSGSDAGLVVMSGVVDRMVEQGAVQVPVVVPDLEDVRVSLSILLIHTFLTVLRRNGIVGATSNAQLGLDARGKLKVGEMFTEEDVKQAAIVRAKAMEYCVNKLFGENKIDVLVTPATGIDTPRVADNLVTGSIDVNADSRLMKFAVYANCTGIPACVVPAGKDKNEMPLGVQFMAAPWNERVLLRTCLWAERELDTNESIVPQEFFDPLQAAREEVTGEQ